MLASQSLRKMVYLGGLYFKAQVGIGFGWLLCLSSATCNT